MIFNVIFIFNLIAIQFLGASSATKTETVKPAKGLPSETSNVKTLVSSFNEKSKTGKDLKTAMKSELQKQRSSEEFGKAIHEAASSGKIKGLVKIFDKTAKTGLHIAGKAAETAMKSELQKKGLNPALASAISGIASNVMQEQASKTAKQVQEATNTKFNDLKAKKILDNVRAKYPLPETPTPSAPSTPTPPPTVPPSVPSDAFSPQDASLIKTESK